MGAFSLAFAGKQASTSGHCRPCRMAVSARTLVLAFRASCSRVAVAGRAKELATLHSAGPISAWSRAVRRGGLGGAAIQGFRRTPTLAFSDEALLVASKTAGVLGGALGTAASEDEVSARGIAGRNPGTRRIEPYGPANTAAEAQALSAGTVNRPGTARARQTASIISAWARRTGRETQTATEAPVVDGQAPGLYAGAAPAFPASACLVNLPSKKRKSRTSSSSRIRSPTSRRSLQSRTW